MLEFREIKLTDKEWIDELLKASDFMGCEYSFANNIAWRRLNNAVITRFKNFYITGSLDGEMPVFSYPSGYGDITEVLGELEKVSNSKGQPLAICSVTSDCLENLKDIYGERMKITASPDYNDYIYNSVDLIEMKGKKFHGKRNHIKRFKEHDWEFLPMTDSLFNDCISFAANSYNQNNGYDDYSAICEQYAINTFFNNFSELGLKGGVLKQNGEMVGFTIGEQLNSNTFVVHIEKALASVQGAYPTLCNEFVKKYAADLKYVNREEDLGIEGVRKSKKAYNPAFMLEKFTVYIK